MNSLRPILLCALAVFLGTVLDALVKTIARDVDVMTLTAWRFLFGAVIVTSVYIAQGGAWPNKEQLRFHFLRGVIQSFAVLTFFGALSLLPLALATVLGFLAALMIAPVARVVLGEPIRRVHVIATVIGFIGAIVTVGGFDIPEESQRRHWIGVALVLMSTITYAATLVLIRLRSRTEKPLTIVMFSNVFPALICWAALVGTSTLMPQAEVGIWPGVTALPGFILLAIIGVLVWLLMTNAYAKAEAARLAPIEYTALVWSGLFGMMFFDEIPGARLYIGAAIIIGACLIVAFEDHFITRRTAKMPASDILD